MSTRTFVASNTLLQNGITPRVGVPVTIYLRVPGGGPATDLETGVIMSGPTAQPSDTATDSSGDWSQTLGFPGDFSPAGCQWVINEGGVETVSPLSFNASYSSTITVATWYPVVSTTGTIRMGLQMLTNAVAAAQGRQAYVGITATVLAPDGTTFLDGSYRVPLPPTDAGGVAVVDQFPSVSLDPTNTPYSLTFQSGSVWYYKPPLHPTGYQGAYNGATTYNAHSNTKADPSDVVVSGGILYVYINVTPAAGHTPASSPTFWAVWAYEPIAWNVTDVSSPGVRPSLPSSIQPSPNVDLLPTDPDQTINSLDDQLQNFDGRTNPTALTYTPVLQGATDNPTATYSHQIGRYFVLGKRVFLTIMVTTTTMAKTTLGDALRVSLPLAAANVSANVDLLAARAENATPIAIGSQAYTTPNASYLQFRQINPTAASADITWAATSPGIGVLTHTITVIVSGSYESV